VHECERCYQACDCDGEDTWFDIGRFGLVNFVCHCDCYKYENDSADCD
jgi:hypothetical protein